MSNKDIFNHTYLCSGVTTTDFGDAVAPANRVTKVSTLESGDRRVSAIDCPVHSQGKCTSNIPGYRKAKCVFSEYCNNVALIPKGFIEEI